MNYPPQPPDVAPREAQEQRLNMNWAEIAKSIRNRALRVLGAIELEDGRILPPIKDCRCLTHEGPHWLHMDQFDQLQIADLWDKVAQEEDPHQREMIIRGIVNMETARLDAKLWEMKNRKIHRLIYKQDPVVDA